MTTLSDENAIYVSKRVAWNPARDRTVTLRDVTEHMGTETTDVVISTGYGGSLGISQEVRDFFVSRPDLQLHELKMPEALHYYEQLRKNGYDVVGIIFASDSNLCE